MHNSSESRDQLSSKIGAILVAAGSSVGLGNIWRFPYVAGEGGGGAFLIVYLGCVLLIGMPLMLSEFIVGRGTHLNAVGAIKSLNKRWAPLGYNGVLVAFLIMGFYFVVSGWTAEYFIESLTGNISKLSTNEEYKAFFNNFVTDPVKPLVYTLLFIIATHLIIVRGVSKGIELCSKILMPLLFLILIVMSINSLMMPNSIKGLEYLFYPDFSKITPTVLLQAIGQAFFSLSIGIGCLITYSSYFDDKNDLRKTVAQVTMIDTMVALLAGVLIFPAVFSAGIEPTEGPSLVFITLPSIFNSLPFSMLWSSVFFLLLIIAALTSTMSLHEVVTLYIIEQFNVSRRKATYITTIGVSVLATFGSLSMGVMSGATIFGLNLFDALDTLTADILMPLGGIFTCIFVGWVIDRKFVDKQLLRPGESKSRTVDTVVFLLKYVAPILILCILLDSTGIFQIIG